MEARISLWLSRAVVITLSVALLSGLFVPVYTDEVGWRFQERAGLDGLDKLFSEACGLNTLAVPPWFMMPVRWYSAIFNSAFADPFWIRISGILYALVWVALMLVLVQRATPRQDNRPAIVTIAAGLLALGTMPLMMVWSRPEQPIILAVVAALIIALADDPGDRPSISTSRQAWLRSLAILVFSCIALSYHVKGVFVIPLMLACLFFASRGGAANWPRIITGVLTVAMTGTAAAYWQNRLACPGDPVLREAYNSNNMSGLISEITSLDRAGVFVGRMFENVSILGNVAGITPRPDPMSSWLEFNQIGPQAAFWWFLVISLAWVLALILAGRTAAGGLIRDWRERRLDPRPILAFVAFGVVLGWSSMQLIRNAYEAKFVLPMLSLAIVLGLSCGTSARPKAALTILTVFIGLLALVSPVAIGAIYGPSLYRAALQPGYLAEQSYSIGVFGFPRLRPQIEAAAKLCGIPDAAKAHALLVDDLTYLAFVRSTLPQHRLGVISDWNGSIRDPIAYLKSRHSDGAVLRCQNLPSGLRARAKRVGAFCCLGPPNW